MATGAWPNMVDVASRSDGAGNIMTVAEMLSQANDIYVDCPFVKANEKTGHLFAFRTSIPTGAWRQYNQGVAQSKSTTAKSRVGLGMLEDYSIVDRALAEHTGDVTKFRRSEDVAFLEGMSQTIVQTMIYGNTAITPAEFQGLSTFYNTVNVNNAQNAANVLDGGGVGSSNCSLWMIGWGPETIFGVYPDGAEGAGLNMEDKSDVRAAYDSVGNPYEAYTGWFRQQMGLVPKDWRYGARIANIDVTSAGLAGPNALDIFATMAEMQFLFPKLTSTTSGITKTDAPDGDYGVRTCFYANRTLLHWMQVQAMRDRNVLARQEDYAGVVTDNWRGLPIRMNDQQVNTESRVV
jgi:hypothetical protein